MNESFVKKNLLIIGNGVGGSRIAAYFNKEHKNAFAITVVTPFMDYQEVSLLMTNIVGEGFPTDSKRQPWHTPVREDGVNYIIASCIELTNSQAKLSDSSEWLSTSL